MTFRIVAGAVAALALAGTAHAQSGAMDSSSTQAQAQTPTQDCSVYSPSTAQGCMQSDAGATQTYSYDTPSDAAAPAPESTADNADRWRRPQRHGWRRLLLPVDLVREGASAVRHKL